MSQDKLQLQRFELKYVVNERKALAVRDFVSSYLDVDEYGATLPNFSYPVHSLYLDSDDLSLYQTTINGDKNRFKLRLRYYDGREDSPVFFEVKRRTNNTMDLQAYLPVILFILVGVAVGILPQVLGFVFGPNRPDVEKNSPYECGFEAFEDARMKFDVRYYLVAILFILFDLEIAFLFPWAVSLREIGAAGFWAMMIFLTILVVGFVYEWKKGALDWE